MNKDIFLHNLCDVMGQSVCPVLVTSVCLPSLFAQSW